MIRSPQTLEWISGSAAFTLVAAEGKLYAPVAWPASQGAENYSSLGGVWGSGSGLGSARRTVNFTVRDDHASVAAAADHCIRFPLLIMPHSRSGTLKVTTPGGTTWEFRAATLISASPTITPDAAWATDTTYSLSLGDAVPVAGMAWFSGMPAAWVPETHGAIARAHSA